MRLLVFHFALLVSIPLGAHAQMKEPCTNFSDSAISRHYGYYTESVKRHGRFDSLCFIFELPEPTIVPQVRIWASSRGIRSWFNRSMSILNSGADSVNVVVLKLQMTEDDPHSFEARFGIVKEFRRTFNIEHCGIYTKYSLKDLSSHRSRTE